MSRGGQLSGDVVTSSGSSGGRAGVGVVFAAVPACGEVVGGDVVSGEVAFRARAACMFASISASLRSTRSRAAWGSPQIAPHLDLHRLGSGGGGLRMANPVTNSAHQRKAGCSGPPRVVQVAG